MLCCTTVAQHMLRSTRCWWQELRKSSAGGALLRHLLDFVVSSGSAGRCRCHCKHSVAACDFEPHISKPPLCRQSKLAFVSAMYHRSTEQYMAARGSRH